MDRVFGLTGSKIRGKIGWLTEMHLYCIVLTKKPADSEEDIATLIGEILYGPGFRSPYVPDEKKWNLAGQNDWWLRFDADGKGTITNRGGQTRARIDEVVASLREQAGLANVALEAITY